MTESEDKVIAEQGTNRQKLARKEIANHISYLFSSDTKYSVIYVLDLYGMLNLKTLSKLLGKSQSTIHKHLEDLMERKYIQIANTMKGKYYEVSDLIKDIEFSQDQAFEARDFQEEVEKFKNMNDEEFMTQTLDNFDKEDEKLSPEIILDIQELMGNALTTMNTISQISTAAVGENFFHIFLTYLLRLFKQNELEKLEEKIQVIYNHKDYNKKIVNYLKKEGWDWQNMDLEKYRELILSCLSEKRYRGVLNKYLEKGLVIDDIRRIFTIGEFSQYDFFLKISNINQLARLVILLVNFHKSVKQLRNEFREENEGIEEDLLTTQIINLFTGPLSKL